MQAVPQNIVDFIIILVVPSQRRSKGRSLLLERGSAIPTPFLRKFLWPIDMMRVVRLPAGLCKDMHSLALFENVNIAT